jgi:hypothetical protein
MVTWRSQKSPGMRKAMIWRLPSESNLVARRPAFDDEVDVIGPVAFADDGAAGAELARVAAQGGEGEPIVLGKLGERLQLGDERIVAAESAFERVGIAGRT